ncbi:hypothetical protein A9Q99_08390 [Gammaproteobacteria bacterium 45_16_T64]|nr:hypothetical protein A9Q99_08390 [Gammaproteobacteria bacterium 45_16_T64]
MILDAEYTDVDMLLGNTGVAAEPLALLNPLAVRFLSKVGEGISKDQKSEFPDIAALSFWLRKKHLEKIVDEYTQCEYSMGLGLVFHIAPSNVPLNFAYSFAMGLLSGNSNIVKLPTKSSPQESIVIAAMQELFEDKEFSEILKRTLFLRFSSGNKIAEAISVGCQARVIWGGDSTINAVRQLPTGPRTRDVAFSDRYSLSLIDGREIQEMDDNQLCKLCDKFYNDSYQMDQNACSSPHFVGWLNDRDDVSKSRFWKKLLDVVSSRYQWSESQAVEKYTCLLSSIANNSGVLKVEHNDNRLYRVRIDKFDSKLIDARGRCGFFYEADIDNVDDLLSELGTKVQTITVCGIDSRELYSRLLAVGCLGVDRIVPIGLALDFDVIWDGLDLLKSLSRRVSVK